MSDLFGNDVNDEGNENLTPHNTEKKIDIDFWNQNNFQLLQEQFISGSMHHAILLLGADGIGRENFTDEFCRWVLCQNVNKSVSNPACGSCKSCQLLEANHHPDYHLLEVAEDKTQISIIQVRELIQSMQESAHQSGWKVAVISQVEALNQSSYNALLKTLEEPQPQTLLILQANQLQSVPATIRSRSQLMTLSVEDHRQVDQWLIDRNGQMTNDLELASAFFPQAPYKAEDFANNGDAFKCSQFVVDIAELVSNQQSPLALSDKWQTDVIDCVLWWHFIVRDLLVLEQTNDPDLVQLKSQIIALEQIVNILKNQQLISINEKFVELQRLINRKSPVNLVTSWQSLLIYIKQVANKAA